MKTLKARGASLEELEEVYRREFGRFLRTAAAIAGDVEAGRDAVQEAFASAIRSRERFRGEAPLEAWLWRAVVTRAHNERRRAGERRPSDPACSGMYQPRSRKLQPARTIPKGMLYLSR